jgi:hypothetical protein
MVERILNTKGGEGFDRAGNGIYLPGIDVDILQKKRRLNIKVEKSDRFEMIIVVQANFNKDRPMKVGWIVKTSIYR